MHLKQQDNLLINQIWTTENFPQEAISGSLSFHPVLGSQKSDYKEKWCQSNFTFWLVVLCMYTVVEHEAQFFFLSLCGLPCLSVSGWPDEKWKIC